MVLGGGRRGSESQDETLDRANPPWLYHPVSRQAVIRCMLFHCICSHGGTKSFYSWCSDSMLERWWRIFTFLLIVFSRISINGTCDLIGLFSLLWKQKVYVLLASDRCCSNSPLWYFFPRKFYSSVIWLTWWFFLVLVPEDEIIVRMETVQLFQASIRNLLSTICFQVLSALCWIRQVLPPSQLLSLSLHQLVEYDNNTWSDTWTSWQVIVFSKSASNLWRKHEQLWF